MKKHHLAFLGLALSFSAFAGDNAVAPDNSGINERDRSSQSRTADDQSQSKGDVELAAKIRRAVVARSDLSVDGQNIKILAMNNQVTLRGPVKDAKERAAIEKLVRTTAGTATVDNQLEIK